MTNKQITQATRLRQDGTSIRDIADQLGVSKSAVDRALKEDTDLGEPDQPILATATPKRTANPESVELGKLDLTLSHEREMAKIKLQQEELALQRRKIEIDAERIAHEKQQLALREKSQEGDKQAEEERVNQQAELLTGKFNRMVRELLKNCVDSTWSEAEADEFIDRGKVLLKKLIKFCDGQALDEGALAIYHNLKSLVKLIETTKEEKTHWLGSDIDIDFDEKQVKTIKSWLIDDFDQAYKKPVKKSDPDQDEEDEVTEEEDEDENELSGVSQEKDFVTSFNELLTELADNCDNKGWLVEDYEDFQERIEAFQTELTDYTDGLGKRFDADRQAITVNTAELLEYVAGRYAVVRQVNDTMVLQANIDSKKWLDEIPLDDFWEEVEEED